MNTRWYRTIWATVLCLLLVCQPLAVYAGAADLTATDAPATSTIAPIATNAPLVIGDGSASSDVTTEPSPAPVAPTDAPAPTQTPPEDTPPAATAMPTATATPDPNTTTEPSVTPTPEPTPTPWTRTDEEDMNIKDIYSALDIPSDGILTGFDIKFYNGEEETDTPTIDSDAQISISFGLNDDVVANMRGGDTYTITLPDEISISQEQTFPLYNEEGEIYATAVVGTNGKVVITFEDEIQNMTGVHGQLHFGGGLDAGELDGPGSHDITLPYGDDLPPVTIFVKPKTDDSIDKSGALDRPTTLTM